MSEKLANVEVTVPILKDEGSLYKDEREPETKEQVAAATNVVEGIPYQRPVTLSSADLVPREHWRTGLFNCCYTSPDLVESDCNVFMLGWFAPCVLYGSTRERLNPKEFNRACCLYNGLYFLSVLVVQGNCLAPLMSCTTRTAIRHRFNLEGNVPKEGCCCITSPEKRERLELCADCCLHFWCHPCALCQEAREVRRRCPYPAPVVAPNFTVPPQVQVMGMQQTKKEG